MMASLVKLALLILTLIQLCVTGNSILQQQTSPEQDSDKIPRQMRQLYHQYKHSDWVVNDTNTIRYIRAHEGSISSNGHLLFSLDAIHKEEIISKAELHFFKRNDELGIPLQADLSEVSPYYLTPLQKQVVAPETRGWTTMDITITAKSCVNTIDTNYQVGVKFSLQKDGEYVAVPLERFLRHHSLPYLMVYSNDSRSIDMDQIRGRAAMTEEGMADEMNNFVDPAKGKSIEPDRRKKVELKRRSKRDIFDNELPGDPDIEKRKAMDRKLNAILKLPEGAPPVLSHIDVLIGDHVEKEQITLDRRAMKAERQRKREKARMRKERRERKNRDRKNRKNKTSNTFPAEWLNIPKEIDNTCGRKRLIMSFEDLGWNRNIIEPKMFEAFYCSGQCNYPFSLGLKPTNHATLQSLLKAVNIREDLPQPCCVPEKLSSVTLLYYDSSNNVVLKSYPDMSVDSCACR